MCDCVCLGNIQYNELVTALTGTSLVLRDYVVVVMLNKMVGSFYYDKLTKNTNNVCGCYFSMFFIFMIYLTHFFTRITCSCILSLR